MDSKEIKVIDEMRLRLEQIASEICKQYELYDAFLNANMKKDVKYDEQLKEFQNELRIEHRELTLEFLKCLWKDPKWRNEGVDVGECLLECGRTYLDYLNAIILNSRDKPEYKLTFEKNRESFQEIFSGYYSNLSNRIELLKKKNGEYDTLTKVFCDDEHHIVTDKIEQEVLQDEYFER